MRRCVPPETEISRCSSSLQYPSAFQSSYDPPMAAGTAVPLKIAAWRSVLLLSSADQKEITGFRADVLFCRV